VEKQAVQQPQAHYSLCTITIKKTPVSCTRTKKTWGGIHSQLQIM